MIKCGKLWGMTSEVNGEKYLPIPTDELCLSMAESHLEQIARLKEKLGRMETSPWQTTPKAVLKTKAQLKTLRAKPAEDLNLQNGLRLWKERQRQQEQLSLQTLPQVPETTKRPVSEFGLAVRPFAEAARHAHKTIKEIRESHPLGNMFGHETSELKSARIGFSFNTSQIISRVNELRVESAVQEGTLDPKEINSIVIPQIQPPRPAVSYRVPEAPPLQHADLWPLPIYRNPDLNPGFERHLITAARQLSPDGQKTGLVLAVGRTLSRHITEGPWNSVPTEFRDQAGLAQGVAEVTGWVSQFENQTLPIPTAAELGRVGNGQLKHTENFLAAALANHLLQELKNPHLTEKDLRKLYREFSDTVGQAAEWIGSHGNETVCKAIDNLPPVAGVSVIARLSTQRYTRLGFPCSLFMSEERMAEIFSNTGYDYKFGRKKEKGIQEEAGYHIQIILDCLRERMNQEDINVPRVFTILEQLDYGDLVLEGVFEGADSQGKEILLQALAACSSFPTLRRKLKHRFDQGDY